MHSGLRNETLYYSKGADETVEEGEARLQQMRSCQAERLAAETVEKREARLQQMRDRLAAESVEEREMRLQQMSSSQRERLAAENAEEGRLGYNITERATGSGECKEHLASCISHLFNSVL